MTAPVFLRNRVPGLGLLEVLGTGTIRVDGDTEIQPGEWHQTVTAVLEAHICSQQALAASKPLTRNSETTEQLEKLSDI